jgi:hypothetical protein
LAEYPLYNQNIVKNSGKTTIAQPHSPDLNLKHDKTSNRHTEGKMDGQQMTGKINRNQFG